MEEFKKVNSVQLYLMWKNLSIGLVCFIALVALTNLFPFYFAPAVSLTLSAFLYTMLYNNRNSNETSCMVAVLSFFYCFIAYSFVTIIVNLAYAWGYLLLPEEFIFFNPNYVPGLWLCPVCAVTMFVIYLRKDKLQMCINCRIQRGEAYERGKLGRIMIHETKLQLRLVAIMFLILSVAIWSYYLFFYIEINQNARDKFVFNWLIIISVLFIELYFAFRYYNLYLDLKEANEIISPEDIDNISARTYLRFYVVCGDYLYVNTKSIDPLKPYREIIDTPFETKRSVSGVSVDDVRRTIEKMTGVKGGELRFFFGRKSFNSDNRSLLRYFYFLDGTPEDYPELNVEGEWMEFSKIKHIYSKSPGKLSTMSVADITRLATIILTEKIFDERGYRKNKIKSYNPTFSLADVRNSELDFQDDKWIRISLFNSDTPMYALKKWFKKFSR